MPATAAAKKVGVAERGVAKVPKWVELILLQMKRILNMASYKFIPPPEKASSLLPSEARALFRTNCYYGHTSGFCAGYTQANLLVIPGDLADDMEKFCRMNSAPFPLWYRSSAGEYSVPPLAKESDVK